MSKVTIKFWNVDRQDYVIVDNYLRVNSAGQVVGVIGRVVEIPQENIEPHFYKDGERIA